MNEQIIITGMGIVSALGNNVEENLCALRENRSGIAPLHYLRTSHKEFPVGEVKMTNEEMINLLKIPADKLTTRTSLMGMLAVREALENANLRYAMCDNAMCDVRQEENAICDVRQCDVRQESDMSQIANRKSQIASRKSQVANRISQFGTPDFIMVGTNGIEENDKTYLENCAKLFPNIPLLQYKNVFGEGYSVSALGVYAAAVCLQRGEIPDFLMCDNSICDMREEDGMSQIASRKSQIANHKSQITNRISKILFYNCEGKNHTFVLLSK